MCEGFSAGPDERCPECNGEGEFKLTCCPGEFVTADAWDALEAAELYEKGLPPVMGGSEDQAAVFVDAARFAWNEEAKWKAQLGILG